MDFTTFAAVAIVVLLYVFYNKQSLPAGTTRISGVTPSMGVPAGSSAESSILSQITNETVSPMAVAAVQNPYALGQVVPGGVTVATVSAEAWEQQRQGALASAAQALQPAYAAGLGDADIQKIVSKYYDTNLALRSSAPTTIVGIAQAEGISENVAGAIVNYVQSLHLARLPFTGQVVY